MDAGAESAHNGSVNPDLDSSKPSSETVASRPVNPLRLARPLEKTAPGLSKTTIPPSRPMPMPTISPLCPPGSNQGKNGVKSGPTKNGTISAQQVPATQPLKANISQSSLGTGDGTIEETVSAKQNKNMEGKQKLVPPKKSMSPIPSNAAPPKVSPVHEKDIVTPKAISEARSSTDGPKVPVAEKTPRQKKRKKDQEAESVPEEEKRLSKRARAPPAVYESPDPEMAQILKTIKKQEEEEKRAAGKNPANEGEEDKTTEQISAKDREKNENGEKEEDADKIKEKEGSIEEEEGEEEEEDIHEEKKEKVKKPSVKRKRKKIVARGDSEEEDESEEEEDDDYQPTVAKPKAAKPPKVPKVPKEPKSTTPKKRGRKPKAEAGESTVKKKSKKSDPVFFKDEYLAVRNDEGTFFLCKAMQNIYLGSRNITIQWLSNEDPLVPAKDNPDGDIFAHDFYDKTEFETILTSVELDKVLGKSKRMILPGEELARINKILQRAHDQAEGKLDLSNLELTEDNPDGLDISLYKGEDQLDEIDRRRTGTAKEESEVIKEAKPKKTKASNVKKIEKENKEENTEKKEEDNSAPTVAEDKSEANKSEEETVDDTKDIVKKDADIEAKDTAETAKVEAKPEIKKKAKGRPKKEPNTSEAPSKDENIDDEEKVKQENGEIDAEDGKKKERRRATKNICYDQFDFLEEEDDEVMPVPKKRKSQDSMTVPDEAKEEGKELDVQAKETEENGEEAENQGDEKPVEELSTSERFILAEKARLEAEEKQNADTSTSENQQPVKKRGRKPKPKE